MLRIRWRKVLLDLWLHKARTTLVILAIAVGVFAIGFIATAQAILLRELQSDYVNTLASSATLYTDPFDDALVNSVEDLPEIEAAEGRRGVVARVQTSSGEWRNILLTAIPDYNDISLDRILPVAGAWPPGRQEIVVERLSLAYLEADLGDEILLEFPDGLQKSVTVTGVAFDNKVPSAEITGRGFAYIDIDTLQRLGQGPFFTELRFRVANEEAALVEIQAVAETVRQKIERSGREVYAVNTPTPGEHWAEDIIATLIFLFFVFGSIILFLAGFLVVNTVTALLTQQMHQIGIMKLVGARRTQIVSMYFTMVVIYSCVALLIGIPAGIQMGRAAVKVATDLLNVTVTSGAVPLHVILIQVAVGLLIPLLAAVWPVFSGVRTTTEKALDSTGLEDAAFGQGTFHRVLHRLQGALKLKRPMILPIRNSIRRKGRVILTLLILVMGTALFIAVLTVRASVSRTLDNFLRYHHYDIGIQFSRPYRAEQLLSAVERLDQIDRAEAWLAVGARPLRADGSEGDAYQVVALPQASDLIDPAPVEGRWLSAGGSVPELVVNTTFIQEEEVAVGDEIVLRIDGRDISFAIVGVVPAAAEGISKLYVDYEHYTYLARAVGEANTLQVTVGVDTATAEIELLDYFREQGFQIANSTTADGVRQEFHLRFNIVILFLVVMAILLAAVGGLGLTTTMSINVLERIREIGVLRAIGASNRAVRQIVVAEGLAIGAASWVIGIGLSIPLSIILSNRVGLALLQMPLDYRYSIGGAFFWLVVMMGLAVLASLGPAHNASRLTIREVLSYE